MGEFNEIVKTSGGFLGSAMAGVMAVAYLVRKFLLTDKVASATAQGNVDVITRLTEIADRAERRAEQAEKRADDAYKERNEAVHEIGALREQVRQLTSTVDELRREISGYKQQLR